MLMSSKEPLAALENATEFIPRHIGPDTNDQQTMLAVIGKPSLDALIRDVVPASIARARPRSSVHC